MPTGSAPPRSKPFDDADMVTEAVMAATRLLMGLSSRSIASVDESITLPQFRLLSTLSAQGPLKLSSLADYLDVNPSTATRMIDRLIGSNLVSRQVNPNSRREIMVELTRNGANVVSKINEHRRTEIAGIVSSMPRSTRADLVKALDAFNEAGKHIPICNHDPRAADLI
ncbi:MAG TPA: MarR family transcriptional regulator [Pseudonocardiaceae bacterium]|jgi:DNA-binding MarR family transcriptional regulator|nr:MarR family transcriptional regulator [Pseudonocardiaceae bacterium]